MVWYVMVWYDAMMWHNAMRYDEMMGWNAMRYNRAQNENSVVQSNPKYCEKTMLELTHPWPTISSISIL